MDLSNVPVRCEFNKNIWFGTHNFSSLKPEQHAQLRGNVSDMRRQQRGHLKMDPSAQNGRNCFVGNSGPIWKPNWSLPASSCSLFRAELHVCSVVLIQPQQAVICMYMLQSFPFSSLAHVEQLCFPPTLPQLLRKQNFDLHLRPSFVQIDSCLQQSRSRKHATAKHHSASF